MLVFFISSRLYAVTGWENAVNISRNSPGFYCHNAVIAASPDQLAVVWEEKERRKNAVRLMAAFGPSGDALQNRTLMAFPETYNLQPDLFLAGDSMLVAYSGPDGEVYVLRGRERGKFFYQPARMSFTPAISLGPKFYHDSETGLLYLFYLEEEQGHYLLKYASSDNRGATWKSSGVILDSEKTGIAVFFPSLFVSEGKFYVVYQGRMSLKQEVKSKDHVYIAVIREKDGTVIRNEQLVNPNKEVQYTPLANKLLKNIIWQESQNSIWNIFTGVLEEGKDVFPVRINSEEKNCYGHSALLSGAGDCLTIFWSMVADAHSQIFRRKYYFRENQLGSQEPVVETSHNSYAPAAALFRGAEYLIWQEEINAGQSAVLLKKQDLTAPAPVIRVLAKNGWSGGTDIGVSWKTPKDPSGSGGFGFIVSKKLQPDKILQNLPPEANSLNLKDLLSEGTNYFQMKFYDGAGNASETVHKAVKVDLAGPFIEEIVSPTHPMEQFVTNRTALVTVRARDDYQSVSGFAFQVDYGREKPITNKRIMSRKNELKLGLKSGISYLKVSAVDPSGNWGPTAVYPFYISKRETGAVAVSAVKEKTDGIKAIRAEVQKAKTNAGIRPEIVRLEKKTVTNVPIRAETGKQQTNTVKLPEPVKAGKKAVTNAVKLPEPVRAAKKAITNVPVRPEGEEEISLEDSEKRRIIRKYLNNHYRVESRRIYNARTEDIIGGPFNLSMKEITVEGLKLKKVRFTIYTASLWDDPSLPPPDRIFIWSPILNYSDKESRTPWVPVFVSGKGKLIAGDEKQFRYFTLEITVLPEADFLVIFTVQGKQMKSSIITFKRRVNLKLIPHSLKWLIYD